VNLDEILDGVQELLTGAQRERISLHPAKGIILDED
jgi:hypothetical protein